jgi:UDP:flavonoid glycosyltransferase YjiC (YdhE family)
MSGILIVTWDGGGNVSSALGLAAELVRRGRPVTVLGHPQQASLFAACGAAFESYTDLPAWDPLERPSSIGFALKYLRIFTDRRFGDELRRALGRHRPDVVVVDVLLTAAVAAAVASAVPSVVLVHTVREFVTSTFASGPVGRLARLKGAPVMRSLDAADAVLVASPEALGGPVPARTHYVGPIFGPEERRPVEADAAATKILVSLSTIDYTGMLGVLQRLVDAVADLSDDVVVTTGPSIDPAEVRAPARVVIERTLPHAEVLAQTALVVGHGGHGTTTKALMAGVPLAVRPMSVMGDQPLVAAAIERAGVGVRLGPRDTVQELGDAIGRALTDSALRARARELGVTLRAQDGAILGADLVEQVAHRARTTA